MKWLLTFLIIFTMYSAVAQDLENPNGPSDYRSAFFGADYRALGETPYANWIDPGHEFCRVKYGQNCDETPATALQVSGAVSTWSAMAQCNRWRIRLHHTAELSWFHESNDKIAVYYSTNIPASKRTQIEQCLVQDEFEFLGLKFSTVCNTLNNRSAGLCSKFLPGDVMTPVIYGWESDAE